MDKKQDNSQSGKNSMFCAQCGQETPYTIWSKRKERNHEHWDWCRDCTAKPAKSVRLLHAVLGEIWCYPYTGELDDLWRPIDDAGELYLPGERLCGLKDCVNRTHIVGQTHHRRKKITDLELLLTMVEVQDYNKRARTR